MNRAELELLKDVIDEAIRTDNGHHWLPEKYANDCQKAREIVRRELAASIRAERRKPR